MTDHRPEERADERTPDLTDADFSDRPADDAREGGLPGGDVRDTEVRTGDLHDGDQPDRDAPDGDLRDDRLARAAGGDALDSDRNDPVDDRVAPADDVRQSPADDLQQSPAGEGLGTSPGNEQSSAPTSTEGPLVAEDAAVDFRSRWEVIQQGFVDDPRQAVSEADKLVDDLLKRLSAAFDDQHQQLERQWSDGEPSTEDLRGALQKYRAFFQRLLAL
jgi:hypothetical protein